MAKWVVLWISCGTELQEALKTLSFFDNPNCQTQYNLCICLDGITVLLKLIHKWSKAGKIDVEWQDTDNAKSHKKEDNFLLELKL